jgi:hypothetical protein
VIQLTLKNDVVISHSLNFQVRETPVAQRWLEAVRKASRTSEFRETNRLYNFPNHKNSEEQFIIDKIRESIEKINQREPGRIPVKIGGTFTQDDVNRVHVFFADSELTKDWAELNNWLHAHEAYTRSRERLPQTGLNEANILVTWKNQFVGPLCEEDYEHFTVAKKFGTCYVSYCQVGRHLYEMFLSGDTVASEDHILPLRNLSADTYIWLGPTSSPVMISKNQENIKGWFGQNSTKLNRLGFYWGDPKLAIGWLPVADLVPEISELKAQSALLNSLSTMTTVDGFAPTL